MDRQRFQHKGSFMTTRVLTTSIGKFTIPAAVLAGLTSLFFLQAVEPATAKPMSRCQIKHSFCSERCIMKNNGDGIGACISRTCERQNPGCGGDSVEKGTTPPRGKGGRASLVAAPAPGGPAGEVRPPRGGAVVQKVTQAPRTSGPIMKPSSGTNGKR
jgi:hypothetical protein